MAELSAAEISFRIGLHFRWQIRPQQVAVRIENAQRLLAADRSGNSLTGS